MKIFMHSIRHWFQMSIDDERKGKLCIIGVLFSFNLILLSIVHINVEPWKINEFGLISILPVTYFIGLVTFSILYILLLHYSQSKLFLIVSILILIAILFGTPTLIEGTPRFGYTFRGGGAVDYIVRTGHTNTNWSETGLLSMYQNWPAVFFLGAFIHQIADINILNILLLTPVVSQIFYFIPLYLIFSILLRDTQKVFFACSLFYVMNWANQDFFACQNMGLFLSLLTLALFLKIATNRGINVEFMVLFIIAFSSVVIAHGLSSVASFLYIALCLLAFSISEVIKQDKIIQLKNIKIALILLMFVILSFDAMYVVSGHIFSTGITATLATDFLNIVTHFQASEQLGYSGSPIHAFLSKLKIEDALLFIFIGLLGLIYYLYSIRFKLKFINTQTIFCLCILFVNLILYMTAMYASEALIRAFLFSIVSLSYFSVQLLDSKKLISLLLIFFIISTPAHILLHYSNEQFEYYSPSHISCMNFFYQNSKEDSTIRGFKLLDALKNYEKYTHSSFSFEKDDNGLYGFEQNSLESGLTYVVMSKNIRNRASNYRVPVIINEYEKRLSHLYNLVYVSGDSNLYFKGGVAP